jgi:large repetitive protein
VTIKNYFSKPNNWAKRGAAAVMITGLGILLSSCGGSGVDVATTPPPAAALQLLPGTATLFATVPANYVASGGLPPYTLLTSNAAVLPVPTGTLSGSNFSLTPNVVSANTDVTVTLRDSAGITATAVATVNPNFVNGNLTVKGNGVESPSFTGCTDIGFICAGQFGTVTVTLTQNGAPVRARSVRFSADQGAYQFVANVVQNTLVPTIDVTTDETGTATAIVRGNVNATLQVALIRATDIQTGAYRLSSFVIRQTTLSGTDFTTVPKSWAVAGFVKNQCPGGVVDYIIFGGTAPYTIRSPLSDVIVAPTTTNSDNPNRFTATFRAQPCGDVGYSPIFTITDATGRTITADLSVKPGTVDGPVNTTLTLSTNAITLACGQQAQVVASVTTTATTAPTLSTAVTTSVSPATALTAAATGNTVTVTRGGAGTVGPIPNPTPPNTTATIVVGAGNAPAQTLLVTTPSTCP